MNDDILLSILLTIQNDLYDNKKIANTITNMNEYISWLEAGEKSFAKDYSKEKHILENIRHKILINEFSKAKESLKIIIKNLM